MSRRELPKRADYRTVQSFDELDAIIKRAWQKGVLCFDCETTGLDFMSDELVGVALAVAPTEGFYVPLAHTVGEQLPLQDVLDRLKEILEHPLVVKLGQHIKFDMNIMARYGITLNNVEDTMLMSYSMDGGRHRHNMDDLASIHLAHKTTKFKEVTGPDERFDLVPLKPATDYAAEDADITLRLALVFEKKFETDTSALSIYSNLERPLIPVISRMERRGVRVDHNWLSELTDRFTIERNKALDECEDIIGHPFNPASPQQVGAILEKLGVRIEETTDTGQVATGVEVLEDALRGDCSAEAKTLIRAILAFRRYAKLIGTYSEGLQKHINPETGRVHPSFGMAHTATGRLSCSDPNIQNIPIRTKEGAMLRAAFIAEEGNKLISADFSQIELRVLAHASGDESLFKAFENGWDIHAMTASEVLGKPLDQITAMERRDAKAVNFGIVYGISKYGLARQLNISTDGAQRLIDQYFRAFPGIRTYMDNAIKFARANGYVETLVGRKVWVPDINSTNRGRRSYAERAAVNAPIQGTAADIIKAAMLNVDAALIGLDAVMLLQVHDELIFEVAEDWVPAAVPLIVEHMEKATDYLDVPLLVDAKFGDNWQEAH